MKLYNIINILNSDDIHSCFKYFFKRCFNFRYRDVCGVIEEFRKSNFMPIDINRIKIILT